MAKQDLRHWVIAKLKTGFNEFPLFKTKRIKGYSYASVILENIKKKYLFSFN